jgi:hypothetical protein
MSNASAPAGAGPAASPAKMRQVVAASAAGTVFEWYDFFVYGALASVMSAHFFAGLPDAQAFVFTLLTFALGFLVRPLGALVFGKIGDSTGRKGAFLITITLMGAATFAIGLLPTAATIGIWAPILLVTCRMLQGFALGGEYGGAAIYVAEHARHDQRGASTGWIQTSAALGLIGALGVVLGTRAFMGEEAFRAWGWRIPFLVSIALLAISVWIRLQLEESPAFQKLKSEGRVSKRAFAETFLEWKNLKLVLLALFGIAMTQGVLWYTAHFYSQFYLERVLKVDGRTVNTLILAMVTISAPLYVFFAWLSDRVGRKPIILGGMILMLALYFPGFHFMTRMANPALAAASIAEPAVVFADPADCSFQLDLTGGAAQFATSCDIAKGALTAAGVGYTTQPAPAGSLARVRIGAASEVESVSAVGQSPSEIRAARAGFAERLGVALAEAGYPAAADPSRVNFIAVLAILVLFVTAATALYGPQAAALVELFPTRIRYTALSVPYHLGIGVFGGMLPAIVFAINTATGDTYSGLWFPAVVTAISIVVMFFFWPETKDRDIHADDPAVHD